MKLKLLVEFLVVTCLVMVFGAVAHQRNFVWKDGLSLWSDVVEKSPNKARPYNNLGRANLAEKKFLQAIPFLKTVLKHSPNFSYAHYNLGIAYQGIRQYDNAIAEYRKTLHSARQPYFAKLHNNLGVCYFNKGWIDMAIKEFRKALNINPDFSDAGYNLRIAITRIKK